MKKANAAIIIIGNEILSGRTQDVNVVSISNWLNELGVKLEEVRIIADIEDSIIETVNELRKKFKYATKDRSTKRETGNKDTFLPKVVSS